MGQAKKRGTFEQRQADALKAVMDRKIQRDKDEMERRLNETPEEREQRRRAKQKLAMLTGFVVGTLM